MRMKLQWNIANALLVSEILLYSLTVEQAKACPDEGRVESTYFTEQRGKI